MIRSYRHIILALVGWLSLAGQAPNPTTNSQQAAAANAVSNASQNVAPTEYELAERANRAEYEAKCDPANEKRNSDLCAQWKAADAAADSAKWTYWGNWIGGLSGLLVLGAIGLAFQANRIARDTAKRQLRAYVSYSSEWFHTDFAVGQEFILKPKIINTGETPARDVAWQAELRPITEPSADGAFTPSPPPEMSKSSIGKGQSIGTELKVTPSQESYARVMSGQVRLYVLGGVTYKDVFGAEQTTTFRIRFVPESNRWVTCPDGNTST